jgi:hypothetical protein
MATPESVLTSRNATLSDMVALLQRQHDAKLDVVAPARDLRMSGGELHIEGIGEPTITLEGVTPARGVSRPTVTCDGGIAEKLGVPVQYLRLITRNSSSCSTTTSTAGWPPTRPSAI